MRSGGIFDVPRLNRRIEELTDISAEPGFWNDRKRSRDVLREKAGLERTLERLDVLDGALEDAEVMLELGEEEQDPEAIDEGVKALVALKGQVREAEIQQMLSGDNDEANALLEINSGAGGTDASDWAEMLQRMYLQWAGSMGYKTTILDQQPHDEAGIKSCQIEVRGPYAYGYLRAEIGVHRLVRISPFDSSSRRHTAFASVHAYPDLDDNIEIEINETELRIDRFRASGAGGQHVNTTDSAVRIIHLPTNLTVSCQNERSQHKNKARALKMLKAKLYQHEMDKRQAELDAANAEKKRIEWGSQIRSYVLHPYRLVKDTRTQVEATNVDKVLGGDLLGFMEAWLASDSQPS